MMRYEVLRIYREHLEQGYSKETAKTYAIRLDNLLDGQSVLNTVEAFDISKVIDNLKKIKYKNHFSQAKNALRLFCAFQNITLTDEVLATIREIEQNTKKKYRKLKPANLEKIQNTINRLKNEKLKLCFKTILKTGLRVSEIAQITPTDCTITDKKIIMSFTGKGRISANITIAKAGDKAFFEKLLKLIENTNEDKKVFYSARYLQRKATFYKFTCHDLRRGYAKREYQKTKSKKHVASKLRHKNIKATNIYLRSKIEI